MSHLVGGGKYFRSVSTHAYALVMLLSVVKVVYESGDFYPDNFKCKGNTLCATLLAFDVLITSALALRKSVLPKCLYRYLDNYHNSNSDYASTIHKN